MQSQFARIVARGDNDVVIGKNFGGLLKEGVVYEIVNILDTLVIREVGESSAIKHSLYGGSLPDLYSRSPEDLMATGDHLLTEQERQAKRGAK